MNRSLTIATFLTVIIRIQTIAATCAPINSGLPQIVPLPHAVGGVSVPSLSLNGTWNFCIKEQTPAEQSIQVPGEWEMQGFTVAEGETAIYSRKLEIPADWKELPLRIRFDAVSSHAVVKVNGRKVAEHEGSFVPFEADLTNFLTYSGDLLEVEVRALTVSDRLACTSQYACHTVGGILRKVTLYVLPQTYISSFDAVTDFDDRFADADLILTARLGGSAANDLAIRYRLTDPSGKTVLDRTVNNLVDNGTSSFRIRTPLPWNAEHPSLYTLETSLVHKDRILQKISRRIGFREITVKGNRLLVNGIPIKLHGVNRHSVHPLTGRSTSPDIDRLDARLFRDANCNYIRTSHYPPSEEFLDACDELGLFVECEASLCWIQHHASPIWRLWKYDDPEYLPFMTGANLDNVAANRHHPSVLIWSLGNESRWSPLWEEVNRAVKSADPTRPTCFHDQCWGGFNNAGSRADIANYHYPGINGPRAANDSDRPLLFGEYAHLTTYNRRELLTDPGVRVAYGAPLVMFYDSIWQYDGNLGGAIWSGIDDIFHLPDGRIVGYGPWGPLDAWRRPKPEYWGMKKAYTPVKVIRAERIAGNPDVLELTLQNRYDFTSFDKLGIIATQDGRASTAASDLGPRKTGILRIPLTGDCREVTLTFTDPRGFICAEERFEYPVNAEHRRTELALSLTESEEAWFIRQGEVSYTLSKASGIITGAFRNGVRVLSRGPVFGVAPMNGDNGGKPNVAGETYQNDIHPIKNYPLYTLFADHTAVSHDGSGIRITADVTYTAGTGRQSYLFTPDGRLVTDYEVLYNGPDSLPYQYGMMVELPLQFSRLEWERKGEFTTWPANDIGRNRGSADASPKRMPGVEEPGIVPSCDWKDDANELGSNDFRSTKRYITQASLADGSGNRVTAISDGTQASRSWIQDRHIQWLIADYSNTGSEPFYGSPHSDGRINISRKTVNGQLTLKLQ